VWGLPPATDPLYPTVGLSTPEQKSGERFKVISVAKESPATAAGFQVGDELVAIDGVPYADKETVNRLLSGKRWGDRVEYEVLRAARSRRSLCCCAAEAEAGGAMKRGLIGVAVLAVCVGCQEKQKAMENLAADNDVVKAASAAANEVVRNATDCNTAKPLIPEAYRQIDEARKNAKAATSAQILDTLKQQVDRVAQLCP
jgi:hypothetical protein